jgi:hypothetical protein
MIGPARAEPIDMIQQPVTVPEQFYSPAAVLVADFLAVD